MEMKKEQIKKLLHEYAIDNRGEDDLRGVINEGEITRKLAESWKSNPSVRKIMEEELESGEMTYIERGKDKKEKTRKITQKERKILEKILSSNYAKENKELLKSYLTQLNK